MARRQINVLSESEVGEWLRIDLGGSKIETRVG